MADRVSASIKLGGEVSQAAFTELADIVADEGLSTEWDGEAFTSAHRTLGEALSLYAHEVSWGRFETLETWCVANHVPYARWSGGYAGQWGGERVIFNGEGEPQSFAADEEDTVTIDRETAVRLGSMAEIIAHFDTADFVVPPLIVEGDRPAGA